MKLTHEIESIKSRNARVERDKTWETSKTRRTVLGAITYIIVAIFLVSIGAPNPYVNAIVPALGFTLSTLTLPFAKRWWEKHIYFK